MSACGRPVPLTVGYSEPLGNAGSWPIARGHPLYPRSLDDQNLEYATDEPL